MTAREREAWSAGYKWYEQYAPALRQAASLNDNGDMAWRLFEALQGKAKAFFDASTDDESRLITVALYGILEKVYTEACRKGVKAADGQRAGNWSDNPSNASEAV